MALFKKKAPDPISERARALNAEIAALESEIKKLDGKLQPQQQHPRLRSTAVPHGATYTHKPSEPIASSAATHEPVFEQVGRESLQTRAQAHTPPDLFNEKGVRKYDLPAFLQRVRSFFKGPQASNPRLVNYLAAGGVQGLRPMRYEKRVARNRFIALATFFFLLLTGIIWWYFHNR